MPVNSCNILDVIIEPHSHVSWVAQCRLVYVFCLKDDCRQFWSRLKEREKEPKKKHLRHNTSFILFGGTYIKSLLDGPKTKHILRGNNYEQIPRVAKNNIQHHRLKIVSEKNSRARFVLFSIETKILSVICTVVVEEEDRKRRKRAKKIVW